MSQLKNNHSPEGSRRILKKHRQKHSQCSRNCTFGLLKLSNIKVNFWRMRTWDIGSTWHRPSSKPKKWIRHGCRNYPTLQYWRHKLCRYYATLSRTLGWSFWHGDSGYGVFRSSGPFFSFSEPKFAQILTNMYKNAAESKYSGLKLRFFCWAQNGPIGGCAQLAKNMGWPAACWSMQCKEKALLVLWQGP